MEVYSQESEGLTLALNGRESELVGRLRLTPTVAECWKNTFRTPQELPTFETAAESNSLTESTTAHEESICLGSTSSAEASPARTSATLASERELTESGADYGASMRESFASFDPATSSWRTSQLCLDGEWSEFSETWPRAGMTQSGKAFELPMLAPHTEENESGLLPTPRAIYGEHPGMTDVSHLTGAIHLWPTPQARDFNNGSKLNSPRMQRKLRQGWTPNLNDVVLWPTPTAVAWKGSGPVGSKSWLHDMDRGNLKAYVMQAANSGQLNPTWVEWLMGYPLGWTDCGDLATPSSRKSLNGLEGES